MRLIPLLVAALASCAPPEDTGEPAEVGQDKLPAGLVERVSAGEPVVVLAQIREGDLLPRVAHLAGADRRRELAEIYGERMDEVLDGLPASGFELRGRYRNIPMIPLELRSLAAVDALARDPRVEQVFLEEEHTPALDGSLDLIDQPEAQARSFTGAGAAVVVLDTGIDYTRAAFGSCAAPGDDGCKVAAMVEIAAEDSKTDVSPYHGTNVAAIVAGVAPGAELIGMDIFGSSGSTTSTKIIQAIDWAIENVDTYNIAALSLSFSTGGYSSACVNSTYSSAFAQARVAGILPVVPAGNNAYNNKLGSPACEVLALSVGAVYDADVGAASWTGCSDATTAADKVACFSNSASFLDMLAPGAKITAGDVTIGGTSQAAAHVAGAVAVLRMAFPDDTAEQLQTRLTSTGVMVTDARQGRVLPRLDLDAALEGATDGIPPAGSVSIDAGAGYTGSADVTLSIAVSGTPAAAEMCISDDGACSSWIPYASSVAWTLPDGEGTHAVYVQLRDDEGDESEIVSDSIEVDGTAPADGSVSAEAGDGVADLSWSGFSDDASGLEGYKVVYRADGALPAGCEGDTLAYDGAGTTASVSGLTNEQEYTFLVCAYDAVGNLSPGAWVAATPAEPILVGGSVVINGGAAWTAGKNVSLALSGWGVGGLTQVCISNTSTCSTWMAYAAAKTWKLTTGNGSKTITAWFKDAEGNVSEPTSDTISLDTTKPTNGTITATPGNAQASLSWAGFADTISGLSSYKVVYKPDTLPATRCTNGTVAYAGADTAAALSALTNGTLYYVRVCGVDAAGNVGSGATTTVRPAPEFDGPTGSVSISGGAEWTSSATVTLSLAATDASSVIQMCISNTTTCSGWSGYATSKPWTLRSGSGSKTVYVWFKDQYGNVSSAPVTDAITLDALGPANGTASGGPSSGDIALSWSGFSDAGVGLASYKVVYKTGTSQPSGGCANGTVLYSGSDLAAVHSAVTSGTTYNYRICGVDTLGNAGSGVAVTVLAP